MLDYHKKVSIYHGLPEELKMTATMVALKLAPAVRKSNSEKIERFEKKKRERDKLVIEEGQAKMTDLMIDRLIYRKMWDSERAWKTPAEVKKGLKEIEFKKDKISALQDNIQMHYLGMGREDAQTNWSKGGAPLSVPQLTARLIEILKMYKGKPVPDAPETTMPRRKQLPVIGTLIEKVKQMDVENATKIKDFDISARKEWKNRTESGEAKTVQNLQKIGTNMLDQSWVGTRVEYYAYYDIDEEGNERKLRPVGGKILEVSDGTWLLPGARTKCYKKNEAASVLWDAVEEANCPQCKSIEEFRPRKFNKDCEGGWRKEIEVDYGI